MLDSNTDSPELCQMADGHFAIILAAGDSLRMGTDKAGLPWVGAKPLILHTFDALRDAGWHPMVIVGPHRVAAPWMKNLPTGSIRINPDPERGKTSSISAGVHGVPSTAKWILITAVDQPRLPRLYRDLRLATNDSTSDVILPCSEMRVSHPVVVRASLRDQLARLDEHQLGLRGFLKNHAMATDRLRVEDPSELHWDLNTPEQYEAARAVFLSRSMADGIGNS